MEGLPDKMRCLITGPTSGIGAAVAQQLAARGFDLVLLGRNPAKLERMLVNLRKKREDIDIGSFVCDLSRIQEVRSVADQIKRRYDRLDIMINNAGGRYLRHQVTKDGFELTLATNHLGHFALTLSLAEVLEDSPCPMVINVSSGAHYSGQVPIENILSPDEYDGRRQYADSKLANVLFAYGLARHLNNTRIHANAVDPGGVATNFARNDGILCWLRHRMAYGIRRQLRSPSQGADTIAFLASAAETREISGCYLKDRCVLRSSEVSYNLAAQEVLWNRSVEWTQVHLART